MRAIKRFVMRMASSFRCVESPKRVEAIGFLILLLAAFFQIKAESEQRIENSNRLSEIKYEVEFTREKGDGIIGVSA